MTQSDQAAALDASPAPRRPTGSTLRNREFRRRRKEGLTIIPVEVRQEEIAIMVERKLIHERERGDKLAVVAGLYRILDAAFAAIEDGSLTP